MNYQAVQQQANENDKSLASFHDAFSQLLGRRLNEPSYLDLALGAEAKLFVPVSLSNQCSPIQAVNPSQIFTTKRVSDANINLPYNKERLLEKRTKEEHPLLQRYPSDVNNDSYEAEFQRADSDYFSACSSPRWETYNPSAFAWDGRSIPRVENIYGNANRAASTTFPQSYVMTSHLKSNQEVIWATGINSVVVNPTNVYTGKTDTTSQWYLPLPANTRPVNIRQKLPNVAPKTFVPVNTGYEIASVPSSWKYVQPVYRTEYAVPNVVLATNTTIPEQHVSSTAMNQQIQAEEKANTVSENPVFVEKKPASTSSRKPSLTKERVRERAIRDKFKTLIAILPYEVCKSARPLRSTILEKAVEYINTLKEDIGLLEKKLNLKTELVPLPRLTQLNFLNNQYIACKQPDLSLEPVGKNSLQTIQRATVIQQPQSLTPSNPALTYNQLVQSNQQSSPASQLVQSSPALLQNQETVNPTDAINSLSVIKIEQDCLEEEQILSVIQTVPDHRVSSDTTVTVDDPPTQHVFPDNIIANLKRPMNSFMLFSKEHRPRVVKENPGLDNRAISKVLGTEWSHLTVSEKIPYRKRFRMQMDILKSAFPNWNYNSYKYRAIQIKRKYNSSGRRAHKKGKTLQHALESATSENTPQFKSDAKANNKRKVEPKSALQWSSWLHGGPYFSCAFPNKHFEASVGLEKLEPRLPCFGS